MQRRFGAGGGGHARGVEARPRESVCPAQPRPPAAAARGGDGRDVTVYRRLGKAGPEARKRMDVDHDALCYGLALRAAGQEAEAASVMRAAAEATRARARTKPAGPVDQADARGAARRAGRPVEARSLLVRVEGAGEPKGDVAAWLARAPTPSSARPNAPRPSSSAPSSRATTPLLRPHRPEPGLGPRPAGDRPPHPDSRGAVLLTISASAPARRAPRGRTRGRSRPSGSSGSRRARPAGVSSPSCGRGPRTSRACC